jgi:hypothetical protein
VNAVEKLKRYMSPSIDHIPTDVTQVCENTSRSEGHKLSNSAWNKEEVPQRWKESVVTPIYEK